MAWNSATIGATELALTAADKPMLLGANIMRDIDAAYWVIAGTYTPGSDDTDSDGPTKFAWDDAQAGRTYASTNNDPHYLVWKYTPSAAVAAATGLFDSVVILNHNLYTIGADITVEMSDSTDFATRKETLVAKYTVSSNRRQVHLDLNTDKRYGCSNTDPIYFRIKVEGQSAVAKIGEVLLCRRRQLKHQPRVGYDKLNLRSRVETFEASDGSRTVYVHHKGRQHIDMLLDPHEDAYIADIETFYEDDTDMGTEPFLWLPEPTTDPQNAPFMRLDPPELSGPTPGYVQREFRFTAVELGPTFNAQEY